ncbi:polygalacturonase ADPG2 [Brachypodium distachyon]|uniref:polygalacturonase ADPG2 n=1 Tax=Brachypodium distachyon TaxID=15368 RepID=UPI000D0D98C4|nr:polygalacturonase ADPG2 [Brachypodium distachyon]|eukprot:XP_024313990.1 polygalacturonase ADPG2 [Brachypodium distachyon]
MTLFRCSQVHVDSVSVTAPADSPNTDGINMGNSDHVYISSCSFQTGDDCVSILSGTTDVNVTNTTCGPGHGIRYNCTTICVGLQGGMGKANGFLFENLKMTAVRIPIDIDQFYCPQGNCPTKDGGVSITDARFVNIHGTSADKQAIQILCSQSVPCRGIYLDDVTLYWDKQNSQAQSKVLNAEGTIVGDVVPEVQLGIQQ